MAKNKGVWVTEEIMKNDGLTGTEKLVIATIESLRGTRGCFASNQYLAQLCGCTERTVRRAIAKGVVLGFLAKGEISMDSGARRRSLVVHTGEIQAKQTEKWQKIKEIATKNAEREEMATVFVEAGPVEREPAMLFGDMPETEIPAPYEPAEPDESYVMPEPLYDESPIPPEEILREYSDVDVLMDVEIPTQVYRFFTPEDGQNVRFQSDKMSTQPGQNVHDTRTTCPPETNSFHLLYNNTVDHTVDRFPTTDTVIFVEENDHQASPSGNIPSLDMVRNFCKVMGYTTDPEAFYDYYDCKGWVIGETPMTNWKALLRGWERREEGGYGRKSRTNGLIGGNGGTWQTGNRSFHREKIGFAAERIGGSDGGNPDFNDWWTSTYMAR